MYDELAPSILLLCYQIENKIGKKQRKAKKKREKTRDEKKRREKTPKENSTEKKKAAADKDECLTISSIHSKHMMFCSRRPTNHVESFHYGHVCPNLLPLMPQPEPSSRGASSLLFPVPPTLHFGKGGGQPNGTSTGGSSAVVPGPVGASGKGGQAVVCEAPVPSSGDRWAQWGHCSGGWGSRGGGSQPGNVKIGRDKEELPVANSGEGKGRLETLDHPRQETDIYSKKQQLADIVHPKGSRSLGISPPLTHSCRKQTNKQTKQGKKETNFIHLQNRDTLRATTVVAPVVAAAEMVAVATAAAAVAAARGTLHLPQASARMEQHMQRWLQGLNLTLTLNN